MSRWRYCLCGAFPSAASDRGRVTPSCRVGEIGGHESAVVRRVFLRRESEF